MFRRPYRIMIKSVAPGDVLELSQLGDKKVLFGAGRHGNVLISSNKDWLRVLVIPIGEKPIDLFLYTIPDSQGKTSSLGVGVSDQAVKPMSSFPLGTRFAF